jgi:hypothetical protein
VREVCYFLSYASFYRRFSKYLLKITTPLCKLLAKEVAFMFDQAYKSAYNEQLKRHVTSTPIMQPPNWNEHFEIISDASDYLIRLYLDKE